MPAFDGLSAAAAGRLYLATFDGKVTSADRVGHDHHAGASDSVELALAAAAGDVLYDPLQIQEAFAGVAETQAEVN